MSTYYGLAFRAWVGLNDIAEEGMFVWTDGSPNTYAKFKHGEPSNTGNDQHCVVFLQIWHDGSYGDVQCNDEYSFLCETSYKSLYGWSGWRIKTNAIIELVYTLGEIHSSA